MSNTTSAAKKPCPTKRSLRACAQWTDKALLALCRETQTLHPGDRMIRSRRSRWTTMPVRCPG